MSCQFLLPSLHATETKAESVAQTKLWASNFPKSFDLQTVISNGRCIRKVWSMEERDRTVLTCASNYVQ